jgi:hypothetical protein
MCCFSKPVKVVKATNIFARSATGGRQYVVYSMTVQAKENMAMILPLPVKKGAGDDAVEFINLKEYPEFFDHLRIGFPERLQGEGLRSPGLQSKSEAAPLEVHEVGDFEASFVPTVKDFVRLDERFRLPEGTWEKLPQYKSYGFAVFKLKEVADPKKIHPMAFAFPRADEKKLFFPTVHIHDGKVHEKAGFDHALFAQSRPGEALSLHGWEESVSSADNFMQVKKAQGIVSGTEHCYKKDLSGNLPNKDTWVESMA